MSLNSSSEMRDSVKVVLSLNGRRTRLLANAEDARGIVEERREEAHRRGGARGRRLPRSAARAISGQARRTRPPETPMASDHDGERDPAARLADPRRLLLDASAGDEILEADDAAEAGRQR